MKIGINCINIDPLYKGGVNTFTFGILDGFLLNNNYDFSFQIYVSSKNKQLFNKYKKVPNFEIIIYKSFFMILKKVFRKIFLNVGHKYTYKLINNFLFNDLKKLFDKNSELLFTPTTNLIVYNNKIPNVLSMHDIQQFHYPENFTKKELKHRSLLYELSVECSQYIQTSSKFIYYDLLKHYKNLDKKKLFVINEGVDIKKFSNNNFTKSMNLNLPDKFIFYPAQLWPHKNHITILKALKLIQKKHNIKIPLILTGAKYSEEKKIFKYIKVNKMSYVKYFGVVSSNELLTIYKNCSFLITAVAYESSSLPILEGMAFEKPIIASSCPSNLEMSEIFKINIFPTFDHVRLSNLIINLWFKKNFQSEIKHNKKILNKYSWEKISLEYLKKFQSLK